MLSAWDLSASEVEMWQRIFHSAINRATNSSHTSYDVVSHFLGLLGDLKLQSCVFLRDLIIPVLTLDEGLLVHRPS